MNRPLPGPNRGALLILQDADCVPAVSVRPAGAGNPAPSGAKGLPRGGLLPLWPAAHWTGLLPLPLSLHHPNGPLEAPPRVLTSALVAEQTAEGPEVIANQMLLVGRGWTPPA